MSPTTSPPTGTQAIDRAAELLVRLIESTTPGRRWISPTRLGFRRARRRACCGRSSATSSCSATRTAATLRPGSVLVQYARRGAGNLDLVAARAPDARPARRGERRDRQPRRAERRRRRDGRPGRQRLHPRRDQLGGPAARAARLRPRQGAASPRRRAHRRTSSTAPPRATIVDHDALQRDLALVRERGYATSVEELEPGLLAVAAGVRERSGARDRGARHLGARRSGSKHATSIGLARCWS